MSFKLAKKCLSLSLILIFLDTTSVDSTENYRIFDREYSLETDDVYVDGNINRSSLGYSGIFYVNYLGKNIIGVEEFKNFLKNEYAHSRLIKIRAVAPSLVV